MLECIQSLEIFLITCKLDNIIIIMCFISPPIVIHKKDHIGKIPWQMAHWRGTNHQKDN